MNDDVGGRPVWLEQWISRREPWKIWKRMGGGSQTIKEEELRQVGAGVLVSYRECCGVDFGGDRKGSKSGGDGNSKQDPGYQGYWEGRFSRRDCVLGKQGDR